MHENDAEYIMKKYHINQQYGSSKTSLLLQLVSYSSWTFITIFTLFTIIMALKIYVHKGNNKNSDDEMHLFHVNSIIHPRQQFQLCAFELAKSI